MPKPKSHRLSTKQLATLSRRLLDIEYQLSQAAKEDFALEPIAKALNVERVTLSKVVEQRNWAEALRKDARLPENERVMWTVFIPSIDPWSYFCRQEVVTRTANTRTWDHGFFTVGEPSRDVRSPTDWLSDLDGYWHSGQPFDLKKFREHAAKVDASFRNFVAKGGAEKEAA